MKNELMINGNYYEFQFGMGFLRAINKTVSLPVEDVPNLSKNIGLRYAITNLMDGDVEALSEVLLLANKGCEPRVTPEGLDAYIESDEVDIDALFEQVLDFLSKANATKKAVAAVKEAVEEAKQKAAEKEAMKKDLMA